MLMNINRVHIDKLYIDFAKMFLDGTPCEACTYRACQGDSSDEKNVRHCAMRLEQAIKEMNDELAKSNER